MVRISKEKFYNSVVNIYLKTGQGVSGNIIFTKIDREPVEELIAEGKLKIVKQHFSHFNDEEWICLTGVYCVEEDMNKGDTRSLDFIRRYLNIPRDSVMDKKVEEYFNENPKEREKWNSSYNEWLEEHKELLEKSFKIQQSVKEFLTEKYNM